MNKKTTTPNSRPHKKNPQVWRRRHCSHCGHTFTTYERPSLEDVVILDKTQASQTFSLGQLTVSIHQALTIEDAARISYELAKTVEANLVRRYDVSSPLTASAIAEETYVTLRRYDELSGLQYGARHGLIASIRRRGRPSTTATNADDVPERD